MTLTEQPSLSAGFAVRLAPPPPWPSPALLASGTKRLPHSTPTSASPFSTQLRLPRHTASLSRGDSCSLSSSLAPSQLLQPQSQLTIAARHPRHFPEDDIADCFVQLGWSTYITSASVSSAPLFLPTSLRHLGPLYPGYKLDSCVYGLRSPHPRPQPQHCCDSSPGRAQSTRLELARPGPFSPASTSPISGYPSTSRLHAGISTRSRRGSTSTARWSTSCVLALVGCFVPAPGIAGTRLSRRKHFHSASRPRSRSLV